MNSLNENQLNEVVFVKRRKTETVVENGEEKVITKISVSPETYEEKMKRLEMNKKREIKEELELVTEMNKVKLNEHSRTLISDEVEEGKPLYTRYYRLETDEEMKERIARDKLDRNERGRSWKEMIIEEMKEHEDSWDQIENIEVRPDSYILSEKVNPNDIDVEFSNQDIKWYDIPFDHYGCDIPEGWPFTIWTKNRVYTSYMGECNIYHVISVPRTFEKE